MKLLHTSDWHLGCSLYGKKRYAEQLAFLDWLAALIVSEKIDLLLVSGDIFDSSAPSNRAQELYYNFLHRVNQTACRHVVIIGGNHDSPTLLNAPGELLKYLGIHVLGCMGDTAEDEVICLRDDGGNLEAVVCAVPFLRERDLRLLESGETVMEKEEKLLAGIRSHYQEVFEHAFEISGQAPVIAMGHLFASGASVGEGEAVRDLYIGNLVSVEGSLFPPELSYTALGHLHRQQKVGKRTDLRYSGSPIPLSFKEAETPRQALVVEISKGRSVVSEVNVPQTQKLLQIEGDRDEILEAVEDLASEDLPCWIDVNYTGSELAPDLRDEIQEALEYTKIELLRLRNERVTQKALSRQRLEETLDDLDPREVFKRCLLKHEVEEPLAEKLRACYNEVLQTLDEADTLAD